MRNKHFGTRYRALLLVGGVCAVCVASAPSAGDPVAEAISRAGTVIQVPLVAEAVSRAGTVFNVPPVAEAISRVGTVFRYSPAGAADAPEVPEFTALLGSEPNPFNPSTRIRYAIAETGKVTIQVFGIGGRLVRSLVDEPQEVGFYTIEWDGRDDWQRPVASGVFYLRMSAPGRTQTLKLVQLK
jgi:hypothetical protein